MFLYYLVLARRSLRRNKALTALKILAIGFGVGASMTMLTVQHVMSADPLPGKSQDVYYVQLEPRSAGGRVPDEPTDQMTRADAEALLRLARADRQAMMTGGRAAIEPQRDDLDPFFVPARWTSADFFALFEVPFVAGGGWSAADDVGKARIAVIARELAEKLFGRVDVVGQTVRVDGTDLRIVGVIDRWRLLPKFYDIHSGAYGVSEQLFVPFSTSRELDLDHAGSMSCWKSVEDDKAAGAPCEWIQFWVELDGEDDAAAYREFLVRYSEEQKAAGRFELPANVRLRTVTEWLDHKQVVPSDVHLQVWIALGFLLVCLINTVGLLLTKFLRRSPEIGVRRALGASRRSIFTQLLVEAGGIGLIGGVLGLGLAWLGLWLIRQQSTTLAEIANLDLVMLVATFALAIASSLLAGVLPAWRACQIAPAAQLKSH